MSSNCSYQKEEVKYINNIEICRICIGEEETSRFINPCACKGSLIYVHEECLKLWILQKNGIEDVFKDRVKWCIILD
jgi:E3 ubiquitin-protein ligase DOA10